MRVDDHCVLESLVFVVVAVICREAACLIVCGIMTAVGGRLLVMFDVVFFRRGIGFKRMLL